MKRVHVLWGLVLVLLFWIAATAQGVEGRAGSYRVSVTTDPPVVPVGKANLLIHVSDASERPVTGATIKVLAQMASMPMGERDQPAVPVAGKPGDYSAPAVFAMAGGYSVRIAIAGSNGNATLVLPLETGQDSSGSSAGYPVWPTIAVIAVVFALAVWIVARLKRTGMSVGLSGKGAFRGLATLFILLCVIAAAVWAVNNLRRPGAMTPLGAQGMAMSTPPPPGSVGVTLATVHRGTVESTVRYTGQAVGYVEQDIYPRVTGDLTYMPFYVGDRVHRGQVLARLDISQLAPQVAENQAMKEAAGEGVSSARADYAAAQAMFDEASAEHEQYMTAISESEANVTAAKDNELSMAAQTVAAKSDVQGAEARRRSAQADVDYWNQELGRMNQLFTRGAVSRDEYQQTVAQDKRAKASLTEMQEAIRGAQAKVAAAQAADQQAKAAILAAQHKQVEAENEMVIHRSHVASASAQSASARQKIAQAASGVRQAEAALSAASANEGYATIRSPIDGVVVQRNITTGTLVQPEMSILRIAQIDPIRVQANVPTADLERVHLGDWVGISTSLSGSKSIEARITSISPSVDPTARIGIVEALVKNPTMKLVPGQFDSMRLTTGIDRNVLVVPNDAVQQGPGGSYVWVADPSGEAFIVHQVQVRTGVTDGVNTSVSSGLTEGQKIVTSGFVDLDEGSTVNAVESLPAPAARSTSGSSPSLPVVHVGDNGFDPSQVTLPAGKPVRLTFLRTSATTCATEVVFPDLGIRKALPLNQAVTVDLGSILKGRTVAFACGLNMFKGQAVIR